MSIITLLAYFPNYSARKVRRLAKQISLVQRLSEMVALGQETGALKGIEADLIEFNLLQAKTEERLNDDVQMPLVAKDSAEEKITDRICVTPAEAARRAVNELVTWAQKHTHTHEHIELNHVTSVANGYINGQSFYTDRIEIQARMSPQDQLPLEDAK